MSHTLFLPPPSSFYHATHVNKKILFVLIGAYYGMIFPHPAPPNHKHFTPPTPGISTHDVKSCSPLGGSIVKLVSNRRRRWRGGGRGGRGGDEGSGGGGQVL